MGIRIADFVDPDEMDVHLDKGIEDLLMFMALDDEGNLSDDEGNLSDEAEKAIQDYRDKAKEYNSKRDKLFAESYEQVALWFYQMEHRGMLTETEFVQHIRELKQETVDKRTELEKEIFHTEDEDKVSN